MRRKGKRIGVCPLCGNSREGIYWEIAEWDVCEPCGEKYIESKMTHPPFVDDDVDLEGYVRERVAKS